jgi:hypothetical protein
MENTREGDILQSELNKGLESTTMISPDFHHIYLQLLHLDLKERTTYNDFVKLLQNHPN